MEHSTGRTRGINLGDSWAPCLCPEAWFSDSCLDCGARDLASRRWRQRSPDCAAAVPPAASHCRVPTVPCLSCLCSCIQVAVAGSELCVASFPFSLVASTRLFPRQRQCQEGKARPCSDSAAQRCLALAHSGQLPGQAGFEGQRQRQDSIS